MFSSFLLLHALLQHGLPLGTGLGSICYKYHINSSWQQVQVHSSADRHYIDITKLITLQQQLFNQKHINNL